MKTTLSLLTIVLMTSPSFADDDAKLKSLTGAEKVFLAKITKVIPGPVGLSNPPVYTFKFEFKVEETLRGEKFVGQANYQIRIAVKPEFNLEKTYIVGLSNGQVNTLVFADKEDVARAKKLMTVPGGWSIVNDQPVSPWASLGDKAWPKDGPKLSDTLCSKSGRPALFCGEGIALKIEQVPAKNPQKFKNDMYGDGSFKVSVTNTTKAEKVVNALLTDGKGNILWADSLLLVTGQKVYTLAGAGKITKDSKPLTIKAGETVTGEINSLGLEKDDWPRGGMRVYFDFVLGEKSQNNFFYYFSAVHDPMRKAFKGN